MAISNDAKIGLLGALLGAIAIVGVAVFGYIYVEKPKMEEADRRYKVEEAAKVRAQEDARSLRRQIDDVRAKYALARDEFVSALTKAIKDGAAAMPRGEPGKPPSISQATLNQTIIPRARRIVDERDHAREGINKVGVDVRSIYDAMDSAIDEVKRILDNTPIDPLKLVDAIRRVDDSWDSKLKLIDALAQTSIQSLGCPVLAANP